MQRQRPKTRVLPQLRTFCHAFLSWGTGSKGRLETRLDGLNMVVAAAEEWEDMVVAAAEAWVAPQKMRVGHWNLHNLTIPAKFARIGGRQLELSNHPARAAEARAKSRRVPI